MVVLRLLRAVLGWLFLALGVLMLAVWIASSIPRNADWREPERGIEIMIETNGVHTAIVMPAVTPIKDWHAVFPPSDVPASERPYTHVAVSWGEREVFLHTPTWADLSPLTALRVVFIGGDSLLHVAHYVNPAPAEHIRPLQITEPQYRQLVQRIEQFEPRSPDPETYSGYHSHDVFYDAPGRYHLGNTCNEWTNASLAAAGVRTGLWTPFAGGVMKWIPPVE